MVSFFCTFGLFASQTVGHGCLSRGADSRLVAVSLNSDSGVASREGLRSMSAVSETATLTGHVRDPSRTNDDV